MSKKNVNVRVAEEVLEEFDSITASYGLSRADLVRSAIDSFRQSGEIYVDQLEKKVSYKELVELSYNVIQNNPELLEKSIESKARKKESIGLGEAYDNVVQSIKVLGNEILMERSEL